MVNLACCRSRSSIRNRYKISHTIMNSYCMYSINWYQYIVSSNFRIMCQKFLACFVIRIVVVVFNTTSRQVFLLVFEVKRYWHIHIITMICFNRKSTHSTPVIELQRSKQYKDGKKAKVFTAVLTYDVFQHILPLISSSWW